jgi:hypothetical protein
MTEWLAVALAVVLVALSGTLAGIAWSAARRFQERRFLLIALAFLTVGATAVMSLIDETVDLFDEQFAVEPGPLLLLVIALALLYVALLRGTRAPGSPADG